MLKRQHTITVALLAIGLNLIISACASSASNGSNSAQLGTPGAYTCVQGSITASGSSALAPLVQAVAQKYQAKCAGSNITVSLGGSLQGLANVEASAVTIGDSDVDANKKTQADLVDHQVAVVPFAIIINAKVGVKNLTTSQIKAIFSGKTINWKQVGGPDMKIAIVDRTPTSGTLATFEKYILGGPEAVQTGLSSDSTGVVIQDVEQNPGAIGYAAVFPSQQDKGVVVASIDGHAPTKALVTNNTYHFWNIEHMYTKGKARGLAQALIDYMASSDGKAAITSLGFISTSDMDQAALQSHQ